MDKAPIEPATDWVRIGLHAIEDLKNAVFGAGLDAVQLSHGSLQGSLVFGCDGPGVFSSGYIKGRVKLKGPLSPTDTTVGVGLRIIDSRQWMTEVTNGNFGIHRPNDDHQGIFGSGSLYASATLPDEEWEMCAAEQDLVLDSRTLGASRISRTTVPTAAIDVLRSEFAGLHVAGHPAADAANRTSRLMLRTLISLIAREPRALPAPRYHGYARIAARACRYIEENLSRPLSISAITRAACTSERSLYRAFQETFAETPHSYVRKLRLNRIRADLASPQEARCTVATLANRWGVSELGRLSSEYRDLFGELPSRTRDSHRRPAGADQQRHDLAGTA